MLWLDFSIFTRIEKCRPVKQLYCTCRKIIKSLPIVNTLLISDISIWTWSVKVLGSVSVTRCINNVYVWDQNVQHYLVKKCFKKPDFYKIPSKISGLHFSCTYFCIAPEILNLGCLNDFIGQKCLKLKLRSAFVPTFDFS